jgi:hypothetical protein
MASAGSECGMVQVYAVEWRRRQGVGRLEITVNRSVTEPASSARIQMLAAF